MRVITLGAITIETGYDAELGEYYRVYDRRLTANEVAKDAYTNPYKRSKELVFLYTSTSDIVVNRVGLSRPPNMLNVVIDACSEYVFSLGYNQPPARKLSQIVKESKEKGLSPEETFHIAIEECGHTHKLLDPVYKATIYSCKNRIMKEYGLKKQIFTVLAKDV